MGSRGPRAAAWALALVPLLYLIVICSQLYVDVPFWDQWELVPRLERLDRGALTLRDLWGQHNEHRPLVPLVAMLLLASATGWWIGAEVAFGIVLGVGIFGTYLHHGRRAWARHGGLPLWFVPLCALLVFSPAQWENWLWGWQIQFIIGVFCTVATYALLADDRGGGVRLAAALGCATAATYSFAAGLVIWVIGLAAFWLNTRQRRTSHATAWCVVAAVVIASYFYDYRSPPGQPSLVATITSLSGIRAVPFYMAKYLGSSVGAYHPWMAAGLGAALAATFAALAVRLRALRHDPAFVFPVMLGLHTLAVSALSAVGRAHLGTDQALGPRYTTISIAMWIATMLLAGLLLRTSAVVGPRLRAAAVVPLVLVALSAIASGATGVRWATARSQHLRPARQALITGQSTALLARLYPVPSVVRERRVILRRLGMSVFRDQQTSEIRP